MTRFVSFVKILVATKTVATKL